MDSVKLGEWVRTVNDEVGQVVLITRLSAFVQLDAEPTDATLKAYLISESTAIEPPETLTQRHE